MTDIDYSDHNVRTRVQRKIGVGKETTRNIDEKKDEEITDNGSPGARLYSSERLLCDQ